MREYLLLLKSNGSLIGLNNVVAETYRRSLSFSESMQVLRDLIDSGELNKEDLKQSLIEQLARV